MRRVCEKCGKKIPKRYILAHEIYHEEKEKGGKNARS